MPDESEGCTLHLKPEDKGPPIACQREVTEPQILHPDEDPDIELVPDDDGGSEQRKICTVSR